ncbi:hypothetical protein BKA70DRAFT_1235001 [Coprinopsis sp. MPI-PUGE-AT-0042]|nr:hypothetical protein BKA70DRAFT_1235001 [Coprinopsis sp. MPI-PUGE-AT-0042]
MPLSDFLSCFSQITSPVFAIRIKKNAATNPSEDVEFAVQDSTQGMHRQVRFPAPWGEGDFAYKTNGKEDDADDVDGIPDDSEFIPQSPTAEENKGPARRPARRPRRVGKKRPSRPSRAARGED